MGQTARTPDADLAIEVGGNLGDERGRNLYAVEFLDDVLDVAGGEALGIQGEDLVVEAAQTTLVLGEELGFEAAQAVARNVDANFAQFALDGLLGMAVATVLGSVGRIRALPRRIQ